MATTKISTDVIDLSGNTEALTIPKGNTGPNTTDTTGTCDYPTTASALYQLNDNANDTCSGGYNGTEIGSPTYSSGKFGNAIDLNGTTQGVELPSILSSNSTSDSSFTGWFKTSDTSGNQQTIVSSWNGSSTANNGGWAVFKDVGNILRLSNYYLTSGASGTDGTTNVADGDWHFIAVVFDYSGATLSLYLDGNSTPEVQISSLTPGTVNIFSGSNCTLGYQIPGGPFRYFPGSIDQCRIFPSALTASQITELYNETNITSTGARPTSPTEGLMRENTTTGKMEFYDGLLWQEINDTASTYSTGLIPSANFAPVLYTGSGGTQNITNVGFAPDFVWIKQTIDSSTQNLLQDTVRGIGSLGGAKIIYSDSSEVESTNADTTYFASFNSNGFTVGSNNIYNYSGKSFISWNWKAGGAATTITAGTVSNDISSDVSANTAAGFSIVKYTGNGSAGATIAHGLGGSPEIVFSKSLDSTYGWNVFSSSLSTNYMMKLNTDGAAFDGSAGTNGGAYTVSSTLLTVVSGASTQNNNNASGDDFIAYCWRSIPGYSKIGFYVGGQPLNTTTQMYFGFTPAWILIKNTTDSGSQWMILDNKRTNGYAIYANQDVAESNYSTDILLSSNGLEFKSNNINVNKLGSIYIYMAFSE